MNPHDLDERYRLRRRREEVRAGSTMGRIGPVRRDRAGTPAGAAGYRASDDTTPIPLAGTTADEAVDWRATARRVAGPALLAVAALAVLGVLFSVFAGGDDAEAAGRPAAPGPAFADEATSAPTPRASRRPLTAGSATASARPTPTATPLATTTPTPAPPPPDFTARVRVCRAVGSDGCAGETDRVDAGDLVVLVASFANALPGDVIGFQVTGPGGTLDAGAVVLEGGGSGYAYAEFATSGLAEGDHVVTALRNGTPIASTEFSMEGERRGNRGRGNDDDDD